MDAVEILFMQSTDPVDLSSARAVINFRMHWMLIGEGWHQMGVHGLPMPELDHPVTVVEARFMDAPDYIRAIQAQEACLIHELTVAQRG